MKKLTLLLLLITTTISFAQLDSTSVKKKKKNHFQTAGGVIKDQFMTIPSDFGQMGHNLSKDWLTTGLYAAGTLALIATDWHTTKFKHQYIEPNIDYTLPDITIGNQNIPWLSGENAYMTYPVIGLYAGSLAFNYEKGQRAAANVFKSMAYSFVISHIALKGILGRNRPHRSLADNEPVEPPYTRDNWDFFNKTGLYGGSDHRGTAMPSLHTTAYFAMAKVIQMEYDNYWLPYGFMSVIYLANFKGHHHWVSDMVLGGIIGTFIGRSVVQNSRKHLEKQKNKLAVKNNPRKIKLQKQLIPQISSSMVGLQLVGNF